MFDYHRFGRNFSLYPQRKFFLLLCLWKGLGHKLLHAKFQTCSFLRLAAGAAKVTCPNVLNSWRKICIIGRVVLLLMLEADQVFLCLILKRNLTSINAVLCKCRNTTTKVNSHTQCQVKFLTLLNNIPTLELSLTINFLGNHMLTMYVAKQ